ncbi:MAG: hypothetical protein CMO80_11505 [Verrucomicrobiales bacterium]|nr:hypothetical protein [Verrucomicrobiales bacterium]
MSPDERFAPGTLFGAGRFVIESILGRGGMGVVCLAKDEMLNKRVALKFLSPSIQYNPIALEIMRSETRKSLELTHPNIIRIYDFHHFADELPFISMEYVEGITMNYLKAQQLEPFMPQICAALNYAHGEGIIHCDVNSANTRWVPTDEAIRANLPAPMNVSRTAHSFLVVCGKKSRDFELGFAWKPESAGTTPRLFVRALETNPLSLDMADIPLDGIIISPDRVGQLMFQSVVHPYRMTQPGRGEVSPFVAYDRLDDKSGWRDVILKLRTSPAVRGGGRWLAVRAIGNRITCIDNGQSVVEYGNNLDWCEVYAMTADREVQ